MAAGPPPVITVQPLDQTVLEGGTAIFTVGATSGTTLSYQWYEDGLLILNELLAGKTSSTLTLNNVGDSDAGQYYVAVKNAGGTVTSRKATLTVVSNTPPVANDDTYTTLEDVPLVIPAAGILTNDTDVNGQALTALLVTNVSQGSLSLNVNGSFTYTPNSNYFGSDSFTYRASDGYPVILEENNSGGGNLPINNGQQGAQSFQHGTAGEPNYMISQIVIYLSRKSGGSANLNFSIGTGINSGAISGSSVAIPASSITNTSSGSAFQTNTIVYIAPLGPFTAGTTYYLNLDNQSGQKVFVESPGSNTYTNGTFYLIGSDQTKDMRFQIYETILSNPATVTINVIAVNDAPVAVNDTYITSEDVQLTVAAPGILANDTDVEGDALTAQLVSNVTHGTLALNTNGGFTYLSATNYNGSDSFTYRANDGTTNGNLATVTINITPVYDPVIAVNDSTNTLEDTSVTIKVLANDYNPDGLPLTITSAPTTNGTAVISGTNIIFTASTNFNGTVVFNYTVSDGTTSSTGTVTINVIAVNDAPVAVNDTYTTSEDVQLTVAAPGILANDTDVEGDALTAQLVSNVTHGTLALNANGGFTYLSATNYNGSDAFTYRANDGATNGNLATVTINITPVYDPVIAVNDSTNTLEDVSVTIKVLANDYNPDGLPLTITGTSTTNGTAVISGTNIVFTASTNFNGTVVFNYTVSDGTTSSTGTVTVTVIPVNDPPVANNDTYTTLEDVRLTVAAPGILANDTDVEGDALTAQLVSNVTHGTLALNTNGGFTYLSATNYNGSDSFTYRANDGTTNGNLATVTINITPVYDPVIAVNDSTNTLEDVSVTIKVLANDYNPDGLPLTITGTSTTNGTAVISGTNIVFTASTNFNGTVVFNYTVSDGTTSSTGTVTVTVIPVNDPPVANNDTYITAEDVQLTVAAPGILANDTDVEGDPLTAVLVGNVSHGTLALNANGGFTYLSATNYNGSDAFTYRANDGTTNGNLATVTINITPVNDAPVTVADTYTTLEDVPLTVAAPGILANDTDVEGDPLTAVLVGNVSHGVLNLNTNGGFTYLSATNYNGSDSFTYRANDGTTNGNLATVTINITPVNDPPVANNDSYTTPEDVPLIVPAAGILSNDTDVEGDPMTARLLNNVTNGTLNLNTNGSFTYNPNTNYNGTDSFTYRAESLPTLLQQNTNTSGGSTVSVRLGQKGAQSFINGIAGGPGYTISKVILRLSRSATAPNTNLNFSIGTGKNSGAIAGSSVSIAPSSITNTTFGVSFQTYEIAFGTPVGPLTAGTTYYLNLDCEASNGQRIYLPLGQNNGYANGTYYQSGGDAGDSTWFQIFQTLISSPATVTITVTPVNDPPVANNDTYITLEDVPLIVPAASGILSNDTDVEGDALTALLVSNVSHGVLNLNPNGGFTYLSATNYNGSDSFTYRANDGTTNGNLATVTINITPVNDAPVTVADTYTTLEDVRLTVAAPGILANDTDVEGDPLTAVLVGNVSHGVLNLNANGGFTYLSATNYNGSDSFTYRANDGTTNGNLATVTINITPVNDPPVANNDTYTTPEDVPLIIPGPGVLSNDTDVEGDPLTTFLVSNVSHGSLNLHADGSFRYTPSTNYNGSDSFTYLVADGQTIGNIATVTINVTPVNDAPIAYDDSYTTLENVPLIVPAAAGILTNDVDVDGDVLSAWLVANVSHGSLSLKPDGSFTYTPNTNFCGIDTFTYLEDDGQIAGNIATVTINVVNTNAPLSFDSGAMTATGFELKLSGPMVPSYVIEASTNLTDWIPISTNSGLTGSVVFTDTEATNFSQRFYRAMTVVNTNAPLSFDSGAMTVNGFELKLSGPPASTYVIVASTNLTDWTPISTNSGLTGSVVFTDTEAANFSQRYYRAMAR